jgi:excisionase family DNA binding protein
MGLTGLRRPNCLIQTPKLVKKNRTGGTKRMSTKDPRKLFDEWNKYLESQFIQEEQSPPKADVQAVVEIPKPASTPTQEQAIAHAPITSRSEPPRTESTATGSLPATAQPVLPAQEKPASPPHQAPAEATPENASSVQPAPLVSIHVPNFVEYVPLLRQEHGLPNPTETLVYQEDPLSQEPAQPAPRFRHQRQQVDPEEIVPPDLEDIWARLPKHLRYLAEWGDDGVAQRYYKTETKESRQELIARLTNPVLSLEDTARLLGVCPATVRRYTDRGWLHHFRTEGNQRRFRLSDIVQFLEEQANRPMRSKRYKEVDAEADQP